jgi:hypothetical protein
MGEWVVEEMGWMGFRGCSTFVASNEISQFRVWVCFSAKSAFVAPLPLDPEGRPKKWLREFGPTIPVRMAGGWTPRETGVSADVSRLDEKT